MPQANSARRMWTSVSCSPMLATTGARASTRWVATAVCVSMAGRVRAAVRILMTAPRLCASMGPPAMTVWPPSTAPAPWARLVSGCSPCRQRGAIDGSVVGARMESDLSVSMFMLEAGFVVKGKPGRGLGGGWHTAQGRSHGNGELYCFQEREGTFGRGKGQRKCLGGGLGGGGKGTSARGCCRSKGLKVGPFYNQKKESTDRKTVCGCFQLISKLVQKKRKIKLTIVELRWTMYE